MRSLEQRLAALERDLLPPPEPVMYGSFEIHYTEAWPDCGDEPGLHACDEHGPRCRKTVTPQRPPVHRSIVLPGPYVPLG
jgi:hypothetical protein